MRSGECLDVVAGCSDLGSPSVQVAGEVPDRLAVVSQLLTPAGRVEVVTYLSG